MPGPEEAEEAPMGDRKRRRLHAVQDTDDELAEDAMKDEEDAEDAMKDANVEKDANIEEDAEKFKKDGEGRKWT